MEDDLMKAKEENLLLKDTKKLLEAKLSVIEDDLKSELTQAKGLVSQLSIQRDEKSQQIANLEKDVAKLKELNGTLIDKAKILQYELNRYRAQASGLERVCANFKDQMEEMFGQVEMAKKEKNRLLQERINLESGVASLKSENVRLIERDKVYRQELEKTKEQISRFERLYKDFKNDVGDVSQEG
jgi:chromosome segregation ATPase